MNLVLLGLPGAGKGTQAKKISREYKLPHIATGDIFRKAIREETPLGKEAKRYIDAGELVPDQVTIGIVRERIKQDDCKKGFILDGFPRTLKQAESLTDILDDIGEKINLSLYIEVGEEELVRRISGRRICEDCGESYHIKYNSPDEEGICDKCGGQLIQRSDDKEETVRNRIKVNNKKMMKLVKYYQDQGVLKTVDGSGDIDDIFTVIKGIIEEKL